MADNLQQVHIIVTGKVQRVGYRIFTIDTAKKTNIFGWVRNRKDHTVEIMAEGPEFALEKFIEKIKIGPSMGKVEHIKLEYLPFTGQFSKFKSRFTK